ncbi:MAG: Tn3 family transposase [Moraxellaceae bacterium]|nr:Tn3 family transposase [Moraxellaceae bacterium]
MSHIDETAYPQLKAEPTAQELESIYTPSAAEKTFVFAQYQRQQTRTFLLIQLKLMQRLGYVPALATVPADILQHICKKARLPKPGQEALAHYERTGHKTRHMQCLRSYLKLSVVDADARTWLTQRAELAAQTKQELPDIINVLLEELIRHRYELPGFTVLSRLARQARTAVNERLYLTVEKGLSPVTMSRLDQLLTGQPGRSGWDQVKREPKRPTAREVASFLQHIQWLTGLAEGLPALKDVAVTKRQQLVLEARALDIAEMRALKAPKRYTLAVLLVQSQMQKAMDDVAEMFIKTLRNLHHVAETRLQQYHLEHAEQVDKLVGQFREVLNALQDANAPTERLARVEQVVGDPEPWIAQCDEHIAFAGNNYYPFLLQPYRVKRALLFQCLEVLSLKSSSQDDSLLQVLRWLRPYRNSHREYIPLAGSDELPLHWLPEKWRRLVLGKGKPNTPPGMIHRKYLELCLLSQIMQELRSGDLYVEHSDQYDDYREHLVSWEDYQQELTTYGEMVGLPVEADAFVSALRQELASLAQQVDNRFPDNEHVDIGESGLVIRRTERAQPPAQLEVIDQAIIRTMKEVSILDVLTETEQWLDLYRLFGPLSGLEAKIDDPRKRFLTTLFCYGCNLGPSQTARSVKSLSRKQVAWLNLRHVTEERLDKAVVKVINAYNRFALPRYWGTGKHVSADGTKWNVYEQNLLSEYHIRYGGYGGIGYYHVSDKYIALFSRFIPCGAHEAIYILDPLVDNESDIQPDTVHGDTQAQSAPVFGLAHLLGIKLMPRIRGIKELTFFKPEKETEYRHINRLFTGTVDWDLIARHLPDMLRVVISIKAGKITPSMILRRLGTYSRKNKLYFAFRELGRVVRTLFLLNYINDIELRRTIHAATNKSEEFNNFAKWLFFGGDGIIAENVRHEQRKVIKYNHLVANMVILHNVQSMSRVLKQLQQEGHPIDEDILKGLSPYRNIHINRFGDYMLDLQRKVDPIDFKITFH